MAVQGTGTPMGDFIGAACLLHHRTANIKVIAIGLACACKLRWGRAAAFSAAEVELVAVHGTARIWAAPRVNERQALGDALV